MKDKEGDQGFLQYLNTMRLELVASMLSSSKLVRAREIGKARGFS